MTLGWVLGACLAAVAGYAAGAAVAGRRSRPPAAQREALRRLFAYAARRGFDAAGGESPGDIDRLRAWLDEEWARSVAERARLETVLAGLTEGIVLLDGQGNVLLANDAARALWPGLGPRLEGRHYIELFQDADCDGALAEALARGEARVAELERPGNPRRTWQVRALPLRERAGATPAAAAAETASPGAAPGAGRAAGLLVVLQDVTEQRVMDQVRRDFVANVSHELQTPLTTVRGYAETLCEEADLDPERRRRFSGHIRREAERMAALVRDLLVLAQLEAPRWAPAAAVDLWRLAREVIAAEEAFAAGRGVALAAEAGPGAAEGMAVVSGREEELRRALANLVHNGVAYTAAGGRVTVRVGLRGADVVAAVADTGVGIPPEALPRIFERFYRVDPGRSRETGGTGLGLAIVKHAVEGHGGRVEVESTPGRGSTFTVVLPAAAMRAAAEGPPAG